MIWTTLLVIAVILWGGNRWLTGRSHAQYDRPRNPPMGARQQPSAGHQQVLQMLTLNALPKPGDSAGNSLQAMRDRMDAMGADVTIDGDIIPVDANGVPAEWIVPRGADPECRMLYIHGGAFTLGSPRSHRYITKRMAEITGGVVLAIDYRLMPEHRRMDGILDCQTAYLYILDHGPHEKSPSQTLTVAGDSAGGNLTLMLLAWIRDQGLRTPDAAVALSPATDATMASPSMRTNINTDAMLGPALGPAVMFPRPLSRLFTLFVNRMRPSNPRLSPLHGDLANLPPTLVQASEAEMLVDDARRYVNKAATSGSPVELQTWPFVVHVWHLFGAVLPEADEAFKEIAAFLSRHRQQKADPGTVIEMRQRKS